jgi:hypothetical protein
LEDGDNLEGVGAVLRSDLPAPALRLWDATVRRDIAPEYPDYTDETLLHAQLIGGMCSSQITVPVDVEELVNLVECLRAVSNFVTHECAWATYRGQLELHLAVQREKVGPPVECDLWLRDTVNAHEEHHCRFETNLTWVTAFLAEVERMALRYRRVRAYLGEG